MAPGWPSFSTLWKNYPTVAQYHGHSAMIDAAGLGTYLYGANTCAIRVSYALLHSGHEIDIKSGECNWSGEKASRAEGQYKNNKYIIRVATMRCYLEKHKGPANVVSSKEKDFKGKKGIIVFQDCPSFTTATGHVDLYDGNKCRNQAYFDESNDIRLFEFSG